MNFKKIVRGKRYILTYFIGDEGDDISACIEYRSVLDDFDVALIFYDRLVVRDEVVFIMLHAEAGDRHYLIKRWPIDYKSNDWYY